MIPVPADFAEHANESNRQLKARYHVGDKTLAKWRKESNLPANTGRLATQAAQARWGMVKDLPPPTDFKDMAPRHTNKVLAQKYGVSENTISRWRKETGTQSSITGFRSAQLPKQFVPPIPPGEAAEAAQYLRATHRPVFHRVIEGKQYQGQYVVGRQIMSGDEIVEYARRRGFRTAAEELAAFSKYD